MAILDEKTLDFISASEAQTVRLGVRLGELLRMRDVVCLSGELGAGKTAFVRGVGRGWGAGQRVTSPTFTLVNQYPRLQDGVILYHVDGYRLESWGEAVTAGIEDLFAGTGCAIIEWAERIEKILPSDRLWVTFRYVSDTRRGIRMVASGVRSLALLKAFRQSAFGV